MKLVGMFADEVARGAIPPVELIEVPDRVAKYLTPISDLVVTDQ
jgi:hypothetical protein